MPAGGQSLVPMLSRRLARTSLLVDVSLLSLGEVAPDDGSWRVGATARQADPRLLEIPLLAECLPYVGHPQPWHRRRLRGSRRLVRGRPSAREEIVDMRSGHICRRTGYEPIVEVIAQAAEAR